jgi:hypothetical protein
MKWKKTVVNQEVVDAAQMKLMKNAAVQAKAAAVKKVMTRWT